MRWLSSHRIHLALFALGFVVFGLVAGSRMRRRSPDPHFVYQADAWLKGQLHIDPLPPGADDPAKVERVLLDDGTEVRGRRLRTRRVFRVAGGGEIPISRVRRSLGTTQYVSFPSFPAVVMLPQTIIHGKIANDVFTTVLIAALVLPLMFGLLRRLADAGMSERSEVDDIWLVVALCFGSVFFFSAVQGRVWFTAHIIGVALSIGYAWCAIDARRPVLAGVLLGLATLTRTPMAFMFPLFALEAWRVSGGRDNLKRAGVLAAKFAAPILVIAAIAAIHNYLRFGEPAEFGHSYLAVRQQQQIETLGMFSLHYLGRNLAVAFTLLPDFTTIKPYISISGHGLAMWFTTPLLLLVLWPHKRPHLHRALWLTVAFVALPTLLYQNSGWVQFGYRFSLDYMVFLIMLLAIGGRPLGRVAKTLIIAGVIINLFGAVTFHRSHQYYRTDGGTYHNVVRH